MAPAVRGALGGGHRGRGQGGRRAAPGGRAPAGHAGRPRRDPLAPPRRARPGARCAAGPVSPPAGSTAERGAPHFPGSLPNVAASRMPHHLAQSLPSAALRALPARPQDVGQETALIAQTFRLPWAAAANWMVQGGSPRLVHQTCPGACGALHLPGVVPPRLPPGSPFVQAPSPVLIACPPSPPNPPRQAAPPAPPRRATSPGTTPRARR